MRARPALSIAQTVALYRTRFPDALVCSAAGPDPAESYNA